MYILDSPIPWSFIGLDILHYLKLFKEKINFILETNFAGWIKMKYECYVCTV